MTLILPRCFIDPLCSTIHRNAKTVRTFKGLMLRSPRALTGTACFYLLDLTQRLSLLRLISIRPDDLMLHDNFKPFRISRHTVTLKIEHLKHRFRCSLKPTTDFFVITSNNKMRTVAALMALWCIACISSSGSSRT